MSLTPETHGTEINLEEIEAAEIQALLPDVADFFKLGTISKVKSTPFGIGNESFFVSTDTGEFVLRVLWEQTVEGLEKEIAIEQQLADAHILTAQLLVGENGQPFFTDGKYTLTATERIEGGHPNIMDDELLRNVGATMASFHNAVTRLPKETNQWLNLKNAMLEANQVTNEKTKGIIKQHIQTGATIFDEDLPTGFIHGDLYSGNLILTPDNQLAVLDFETTERNVLIVDIARTILDMCAENQSISPKAVDELLTGYEQVRQLLPSERANLSRAILYVSGAMAAWLLVRREQNEVAHEILTKAASLT